jgi:hypothetical protein
LEVEGKVGSVSSVALIKDIVDATIPSAGESEKIIH